MININENKCNICGQCVKDCPTDYLELDGERVICSGDNCLKCYHCIAICPQDAVSADDADMSEVKHYIPETFDIAPEVFLNAIKLRRSVRHFTESKVEHEKIQAILDAGRFSPTGSNSQDVSYIVVENDIEKLTELSLKSLYEKMKKQLAASKNANETLKRYAERWEREYSNYRQNPQSYNRLFFDSKAIIIIVSNSTANANLAAANMEMMASILGLGACHIGFFIYASSQNSEIKTFLGLSDKQNVAGCLAIGYPDVKYKRTVPRKKGVIKWR